MRYLLPALLLAKDSKAMITIRDITLLIEMAISRGVLRLSLRMAIHESRYNAPLP
jgi:hypothetical protein